VPLLSQGNFRQVVAITSKSDSAIGQILNYGLARIQSARRRDDIEKAMEESLMEVVPPEKANLLSASISVAMNCTAFGLMTAVPILFLHALLQTKTTELIDSLEMASVKFLNAITERQAPAAGAQA
jgi:biopolymer transport protein ExbB